jgi:outer membrane receptor protein involved in Fe transport
MKNLTKPQLQNLLLTLSGGCLLTLAAPAQDAASGEEEAAVFELNPFVVESSGDMGYLATNTLAGTRINTELKDVGASVSVYTEEFLKDIDATEVEDILTYTTSGEGGGSEGNFGGFTGETSDEVRDNPSGVNRFRALAPATRTRDYFESTIPSDGYNFGRVTVSRGPNAILAGTGSAGGVVNVTLKKAIFKDTNQINYQLGEHGSHRGELHLNRVLIEDKLAFRIDALAENEKFRQYPAYENDRRLYAAATWRVREPSRGSFFGRTTVRANAEIGSIEGVPQNMLPPPLSMDSWFEGIDPRDGEPWAFPKWRYAAVVNQAYDKNGYQLGTGTRALPNNAIIQNFPVYRQWTLVFPDPTSPEASVGLPGSLANVQGFQSVIPSGASGPGGAFRSSGDLNRFRVLQQGFYTTRLMDRDIFDFYNNLITGGLDYREQSFDSFNIRLEQLLMDGKAGFEIAYDKQHFRRYRDFPISGWDNFIGIDTSEFLSVRTDAYNEDGPLADQLIPNPNFGRPFIVTRDVFRDQTNTNDYESFQANAFIRHDFSESDSGVLKWLGRHTLNGLFFKTTQENTNRTFRSSWSPQSELDLIDSLAQPPGVFGTQVNGIFYLGDSQVNARSLDQVRLQPISTSRPSFNQDWTLRVYDPASGVSGDPDDFVGFTTGTAKALRVYDDATRDEKEDIESVALFLNSHWLDDHVVTLFGWRRDNSDTFTSLSPERNLETGELDISQLELVPASSQEKDSWTYSVVVEFPEKYLFELPLESDLRLFWNSSGNFDPVGQRRNVYNEEVGSPEAETEEMGFSLVMFGGKLDLRVTKFKTEVINAQVDGIRNPYSYINALINRMIGAELSGYTPQDPTTDPNDLDGLEWSNGPNSFETFEQVARAFYDAIPQRLQDRIGPDFNFNPRFIEVNGQTSWESDNITNLSSLSDVVSEGYEFELVLNPTRNWRIAINVAQAEAVRANIAALELEFVDEFLSNVDNSYNGELNNFVRNPGSSYEPWRQQYLSETVYGLRADAAQSGTVTPEIREWRANLVTRYEFTDGFLEGFRIGGAVRWQDKAALGYPSIRDENNQLVADLDNPYFGPDSTYIDLNLGYRREIKLFGKDVDWTINLNIRNIMDDNDLIPVAINPDGSYGTVRVPPERTWRLTSSFAF